jgi:hypothetical protein
MQHNQIETEREIEREKDRQQRKGELDNSETQPAFIIGALTARNFLIFSSRVATRWRRRGRLLGTVRVAAPVEAAVRATAGATTGRGPGSKPKQACHMLSAIDQSARRPCWLALYSLSEHHYYHWVTGTHASIRPLGTANTHGRRRRGPRIHTNCDADAPPAASRSFLQPATLGTFRLSLLPHLSFCFSPGLCWNIIDGGLYIAPR